MWADQSGRYCTSNECESGPGGCHITAICANFEHPGGEFFKISDSSFS